MCVPPVLATLNETHTAQAHQTRTTDAYVSHVRVCELVNWRVCVYCMCVYAYGICNGIFPGEILHIFSCRLSFFRCDAVVRAHPHTKAERTRERTHTTCVHSIFLLLCAGGIARIEHDLRAGA